MKIGPIVYLVNQYPAVSHTFIRREILALERQGLEVVRVAMRPGRSLVDPVDLAERSKTTYILENRARLAWSTARMIATHPAKFLRAFGATIALTRRSDRSPPIHFAYLVEACRLALLMRKNGASHLHAHFGTNPAEVAMLTSQLCGVTYSFTVHGYDEYDKPEFLALRAKIREATFVVAVSHYGRSQLLRWCDRRDRDKIRLVRCGIDSVFANARNESAAAKARFVCVARFCREKAQDVLIEAVAILASENQSFELVLVGDGDTRSELEELVGNRKLTAFVRMTGWLSGPEVRDEILAARALVTPSFAENLPVVIMEAMSLRRPVIATHIAGISELVFPGETGWLVPPSSAGDLADAMRACIRAADSEIQALGERGRERVLAYHNVDTEAAKLAALFPWSVRSQIFVEPAYSA